MEASANLEALLKGHQAAELRNKILPQKVLQPQQHLSVASAFVSALPLLPLYDLTDASNTATAMAAGQANLPRLPTTSTLELLSYSSADHLLTIPASSNVNIGPAQCKPSNTHHVGHHCHTAQWCMHPRFLPQRLPRCHSTLATANLDPPCRPPPLRFSTSFLKEVPANASQEASTNSG